MNTGRTRFKPGYKVSPETIRKRLETRSKRTYPQQNTGRTWFKAGYKMTDSHRKNLSDAMKGHQIYKSEERNRKISEALKGPKSPSWKGGITTLHRRERNTRQYKHWRDAVRNRDDWRCYDCGSKSNIQADHIFPFSKYPRLRYMLENGISRCRDCHEQTPTFGGRANRQTR
jgi:NUMOD3 motif